VYDLTSWIGKHPGGDKAILASCGIDSTEMFDGKHGMDPKKREGLESFRVMLK
jgi:cytochrome b involved in lipid metabolism